MSAPKRVKNGSAEIEWGCGVIYHGSGLSNTLIGHQTGGFAHQVGFNMIIKLKSNLFVKKLNKM